MNNFVTGGGGFIGSHLIDKLLSNGEEVTVLDIYKNIPNYLLKHKNNKNFQYISGDIADLNLLKKIFNIDYDKVFHLAAIVGVKNYCSNPLKTISVNIDGTRNIIEMARSQNFKVIFSSTSEIFGKNTKVPWSETSDRVLGPTNVDRWSYSTSKSICEHILFAVNKQYGIPIIIVRFFNAYGPRQKPIFVIPSIIDKIIRGNRPIIYDKGKMTRCFTFVEDIINGVIKSSNSSKAIGESFNLGNTNEININDVVHKILKKMNKNKTIKPKYIDTKKLYNSYEDLQRRIPDVSKANRLLDWDAKTSLDEGLEKTIPWYIENKDYFKNNKI